VGTRSTCRGVFALLLPLALAVARDAAAQPGTALTWNDCFLGVAAGDLFFDCATDAGQEELFCALRLQQPTDGVIALECVVDLQHADPALPDWWQLGSGGCRAGNLTASADYSGLSACADPWGGAGSATIQQYQVGAPRGAPNQVRILAVSFVPSPSAASLDATSTYYAARVIILNGKTTGLPACAGCVGGACLVLNSILVRRLPGSGGDVYLETPVAAGANWATWRGGSGASCSAVPARRSTWGALKSLYR